MYLFLLMNRAGINIKYNTYDRPPKKCNIGQCRGVIAEKVEC
jgi:hypothetical protein